MQPTARERPAVRFPDLDDHAPKLDPPTVADAMERVRERIHAWLDRIEALAVTLREGDRALEEQRNSLRAEIDRHRQQWDARVEELDHDRRLLAEAWERLELEQQSANASLRPSDERAPADSRSEGPPPQPPPVRAPSPSTDSDGVVDRAILRQFEALRRDVRRTAESRGSSAP